MLHGLKCPPQSLRHTEANDWSIIVDSFSVDQCYRCCSINRLFYVWTCTFTVYTRADTVNKCETGTSYFCGSPRTSPLLLSRSQLQTPIIIFNRSPSASSSSSFDLKTQTTSALYDHFHIYLKQIHLSSAAAGDQFIYWFIQLHPTRWKKKWEEMK